MTLNCSETSGGEEALLPSIPKAGGPQPQGYETPPQPRLPLQLWDSPLLAGGKKTKMEGHEFTAIHLDLLLSCEGGDMVLRYRADL